MPTLTRSKLSIVIIDDNGELRGIVAELLTSWGHDVSTAADGDEGTRLVLSTVPDVAFVNLGLPPRDGYVVAQELRSEPKLRSVQFIAFTGFNDAATRARVRSAGFAAHLVKPVSGDQLRQALSEAVSKTPSDAQPE